MNFLSIPFIILFISTFLLLIATKSLRIRKVILLISSCVFYAYWDWRFFLLLAVFTTLNFMISQKILVSSIKNRRIWFIIGIILSLGFLVYYKYFNFFIDSINILVSPFSWKMGSLSIILPLGISFYTFESLSYLIDIYRETARPAKSLLDYCIFMTFFPRMVSGPIIRPTHFFSQMDQGLQINFCNFVEGIQIILRGLIKKLVVADNLAPMTNIIFTSPSVFSSSTIWIGVFAYSIQIFCDFSGYSDMAIGVSKIIGLDLPANFNLPYTSQSVTEFWRRWHMTLSSWFRDYVFYPLEIQRARKSWPQFIQYFNIIIVFILTGLWHGAGWNFILWGGLFGLYLSLERFFYKGKISSAKWSSPISWIKALFTFTVVSFTWVVFNSNSFQKTLEIYQKLIFVNSAGINWNYSSALLLIPIIIFGGFIFRIINYNFQTVSYKKSYMLAILLLQVLLIFFFAATNTSPFIYSQF